MVEYSLPVFSVDVKFEADILNPILVVEVARWCIEEVVVWSKCSKVWLQEFRIIPKFEARIGCQVFIG